MIIELVDVGPMAANCYLGGAESNKEGLIIDPGAEADTILDRVKELELKIKIIVLTHAHFDHIGALGEVKEATGAEFLVHADDVPTLQRRHQPDMFPGLSRQPPPTPDRLLHGGDSLDVGDVHFLVLHTPGHTPGGICLLGEGVVFTGDTLFNLSIGRTDRPGGSYDQLMNAIHTKLMVLPNNTVVYPGHGPATTIGTERLWNPFLR